MKIGERSREIEFFRLRYFLKQPPKMYILLLIIDEEWNFRGVTSCGINFHVRFKKSNIQSSLVYFCYLLIYPPNTIR